VWRSPAGARAGSFADVDASVNPPAISICPETSADGLAIASVARPEKQQSRIRIRLRAGLSAKACLTQASGRAVYAT